MGTDHGRGWLYGTGWLISAGVTLVAFRMWHLHLREVEQRAEEAERTRDEVARRQTMEERLRIARELHDSLTHSISVIRVQAGVAAHLARKRGEEVPSALLAIKEASADAARELRATLDVLRSGDADGGTGLDQLAGLIARAQAAGLTATVTVTGTERRLPPDVDQAAYRIVQEALTNVSRHAGPADTSVRLGYGQETLIVQIDNDAPGSTGGMDPADGVEGGLEPSSARGLGLIGMRERVAALGGRLHAGPREQGGFRVRAELPMRPSP
ncbi:sensor histidine kinase [Actinoallomurus acaciae]|uniref:histidine kinase n=1 Tax=Actinoallomurus acaciae TaxID=502577 RepID=A0ABV5Y808_9ACTN